MKRTVLLVFIGILFFSLSSRTFAMTGKEIAQKVHDRENGNSSLIETKMILINENGQEKERSIRAVSKEYGELSKTMIRFLSPADVKGTGFLVWENTGRDDDQFLYLPALKQDPRRIASSEKSSRFMGTEFTYEDLESRKVDDDAHTLLREETYKAIKCYVVESVPKNSKDTQYSKYISWIRPDIWLPIKIEFYDKNGELLKIMTANTIEKIDGIWTVMESEMDNVQEGKKTRLIIDKIQYNLAIPDDYFTERYLKKE
jgi:outer membrane lipoprotein-sorting protein